MKPCRKLRPPTGPISPAQNAPASGTGAEQLLDHAGVVVRARGRGGCPRPLHVNSSAASPRTPVEQRAQVLVGGVGVPHLELHGRADVDALADRERAAALVGAEHVAHEEVAAVEVELVLVDDDADVQAVAHQLAFVVGRGLHELLQARHRGLARELVDEVALGAWSP